MNYSPNFYAKDKVQARKILNKRVNWIKEMALKALKELKPGDKLKVGAEFLIEMKEK